MVSLVCYVSVRIEYQYQLCNSIVSGVFVSLNHLEDIVHFDQGTMSCKVQGHVRICMMPVKYFQVSPLKYNAIVMYGICRHAIIEVSLLQYMLKGSIISKVYCTVKFCSTSYSDISPLQYMLK